MFLQVMVILFSMLLFVGLCGLQINGSKETKLFSGIIVFFWILFLWNFTDLIFSVKTIDPIPIVVKFGTIFVFLLITTILGGWGNLKILFQKNLLEVQQN
ncbi:MAG: hypothetical protein WC849_02365 [Candidatus Paceibacterota bacterium]